MGADATNGFRHPIGPTRSIAPANADASRASRRPGRQGSVLAVAVVLAVMLVLGWLTDVVRVPGGRLYGQTPEVSPAVFVPDSSRAQDRFRLAERLEGQREWGKAADVYQEIVDTLGDRVMPAPDERPAGAELPADAAAAPRSSEPEGLVLRYETVARQVERRLSRWPEAGLRIYRERFEPLAAELTRADDPSAWSLAVDRYFVTEASLDAAVRLIDHRIESGELAGAETLLRRLLEFHPSVTGGGAEPSRRREVLLRGALVAAGLGDTALSEARLTLLEALGGASRLAGKEVTPAEVRAAATRLAEWSAAIRTEVVSWPMPGGSPSRGAVSAATARPTARVALVELPDMPSRRGGRPMQPALLQQIRDQEERARREGTAAVIYPAVDRGQLFFQDGSRLWAVALESGLPLPGWVSTHGGNPPGVYTIARPVAAVNSHLYTVTLTADAVLAVMGYADVRAQQWMGQEATPSQTRVVRLDRETGRVVWESMPSHWAEAFADYRTVELSGSPVVVGERVFVAARGSKGNQFSDAFVVCLDYETGRLIWATFVASAASSMQVWMDGSAGSSTVTHLAAEGGRVFFQSNLGAVAALDAVSGRPEWIVTYMRSSGADRTGWNRGLRMSMQAGAARPWAYNPPIVHGGLVFSLPTDSRELLVLNAADGKVVRRLEMAEFDRAEVLIHADGQRAVVASDSSVFALDWRRYRGPGVFAGDDEVVLWRSELAGSVLRGRPFLTRTALFVPTQTRMLVFDPVGGKAMAAMPDYGRRWEGVEGQGHIVAAGEHLVVAGMGRVEVYTDVALAEVRYRNEVAQRPRSARPRLRWAEVLFNAGRIDEAVVLMEEAARWAAEGDDDAVPEAGQGAPSPADLRTRLYATALAMADSLTRAPPASGDKPAASALEQASRLYRLSRSAAQTPGEQVESRRRLAATLARLGDAEAAVALWQEVLAEPALRDAMVQEEATGFATPAGRLARREVSELRRRFPESYQRFEREALRGLESASAAGELVELSRRYPNATAAPEAMLRAAELLEVQGEPRAAERVLRELFISYADFPKRARVAESLVRLAMASSGRWETAAARLAMAARLFPDHRLTAPLVDTHDGGTVVVDAGVSFAEAAGLLRRRLAGTQRRLPDVRLPDETLALEHRKAHRRLIEPVRVVPERSVTRVVSVVPTEARREDGLVVQLTAGELGVVSPGHGLVWTGRSPGPMTTGAVWLDGGGRPEPAPPGVPAGLAWSGLLLAWDAQSVAAYAVTPAPRPPGAQPPSAAPLWRLQTDTLPAVELARGLVEDDDRRAAAEVEGAGQAVQVIRQGNQQLLVRGNMVVRGNVLLNVRGAGNARVAGETIVRATLSADRLVVATASGRLLCIHPVDGTVLWQTRATTSPATRLLASDDFVAVVAADEGSSQLVALDADTGTVLWRRTSVDLNRSPINAALSSDGILIFTLPDRLCGKDLLDLSETLTFESPADPSAPFLGMSGPRHLIVADDLVLAMSDTEQFVRAFSLAGAGRPLRYPARRSDGTTLEPSSDAIFATRQRTSQQPAEPSGSIHVDGRWMYVLTSRSVVAYDLTNGTEQWQQAVADGDAPFHELFLTRRHVLVTTRPVAMPGEGTVRVLAMSRSIVDGRESGLRVHDFTLGGPPADRHAVPAAPPPARPDAAGPGTGGDAAQAAQTSPSGGLVRLVQPVDGGLYYLTLDAVLRFAAGTAPP